MGRQLEAFHSTGYPGDLKFPGRIECRVQQDLMGTRMEVPPPCDSLMARGGEGEVKPWQAEPGGVEV